MIGMIPNRESAYSLGPASESNFSPQKAFDLPGAVENAQHLDAGSRGPVEHEIISEAGYWKVAHASQFQLVAPVKAPHFRHVQQPLHCRPGGPQEANGRAWLVSAD